MRSGLLDELLVSLGAQIECYGKAIQTDSWQGLAQKVEALRQSIEGIEMAVKLRGK